jgi:antirestriction protein
MQCYISTYGLYNSGYLTGRWFDADEIQDSDEVLSEIQRLAAKDGVDPEFVGDELMVQDTDGFPIDPGESLARAAEIAEIIGEDEEMHFRVSLLEEAHGLHGLSIEEIRDTAQEMHWIEGNNREDCAAEFLEEMGELNDIPENLRNYFDFEAYARDMVIEGWAEVRKNGRTYLVSIG